MFIKLLNNLFDFSGLSPTTEPRPLLIFISLSIVTFLSLKTLLIFLRRSHNLTFLKSRLKKYTNLLILTISILLITNFIGLILLYLINGNFNNHTEPTISAVSWLFQTGQPIYHKLDSAERYSLIYGPMLYLINGLFLKLFEPSILTAKLTSFLAVIVSLILIFLIFKKNCNIQLAVIYCAYITLVLLCFGSLIYTVRADSLILMFVSLGLLGAIQTNPLIAAFSCAIALGISINLKLSSIFYFLPIYILLQRRYGYYYTLTSIMGSLFIGIAPFFLPHISLKNYILWIQKISNHGFSVDQFKQNIEWNFYLFAPITIALIYLVYTSKRNFKIFIAEHRPYSLALILSAIIITLIAAKPGSGVHHLIPFIPLEAYWFSLIMIKTQCILDFNYENKPILQFIISLFIALYLASFQTGLTKEILTIDYLNTIPAFDILEDINNVKKLHPAQTIEMGYGTNEDYYFTFYRPILVFDGNPYLVDADALMDMQKSDLPIPYNTLKVLKSCRTKIWLIPKGKPPFQQPNYYPPNKQIFSDAFKEIFIDRYESKEHSQYYDIWSCKEKKKNNETNTISPYLCNESFSCSPLFKGGWGGSNGSVNTAKWYN